MRKEEQKNKIISFYKKNRRLPGYKEIMEIFGFKSKNSVHKLISWLVDEGVVSKDKNGRIVPSRVESEFPLLGLVEAGFPTDVDENNLDTISLEDFLVEDKENTYILEVKGDSMSEAHIDDGDYVLVERVEDAKDGEIVVAQVDGGWTLKYLRKGGSKVWLEPANMAYKPIYPTQSFRVAAVLKAVIRKF